MCSVHATSLPHHPEQYAAFIVGYLIYDYVEGLHKSYTRKNPADFAHEV